VRGAGSPAGVTFLSQLNKVVIPRIDYALPEREYFTAQTAKWIKTYRSGSFSLQCSAEGHIFPSGNMDSNSLGQAVRRERKAQGLRQDELAAASGVGARFIIDLEAGKPTVQLEKALQVLRTLGLGMTITPPVSIP